MNMVLRCFPASALLQVTQGRQCDDQKPEPLFCITEMNTTL